MTGAREPVDVNGQTPSLAGHVLERLIAEETWYCDSMQSPANVIWLLVDGEWHRLYFDFATVFWRRSATGPKPYKMPELEMDVRLADLGAARALDGVAVREYTAHLVPGGVAVELEFDSGRRVGFRNVDDRTLITG